MAVLVAMGGGALLSFSFGKKGGAAEICENRVTTGEMGELPLFPLLIKGEGEGVSSFRIKKPPHDLSHDAAFNACRWGRARWVRSKIQRNLGHPCPCPVLGLAQQRSAPCMAQARGLLSVY